MSSRSASRLDPGLIARKGEAVPAGPSAAPAATGPAEATTDVSTSEMARARSGGETRAADIPGSTRGLHGTIAVTVRLDPRRYERLKVHGARLRRTNQEILVEALDRYFRDVED